MSCENDDQKVTEVDDPERDDAGIESLCGLCGDPVEGKFVSKVTKILSAAFAKL